MAANRYRLVIGNKNWSSWSLRPWLAMRRFGVPFEEINVRLRLPESKAEISRFSPSGLVPLLLDGNLAVWDSLAILEYLADEHPDLGVWPADRQRARWRGAPRPRSIPVLAPYGVPARWRSWRRTRLTRCPKTSRSTPAASSSFGGTAERSSGRADRSCSANFSAADAMYAPVASRFRTYLPDLAPFGDDGTAAAYAATIFAMPEMAEWVAGARAEVAAAS